MANDTTGTARTTQDPIPPGATKRAADSDLRPGERPSPLGDHHAAGTPAGGSAVGGLGGTNIAEGSPHNADLEEAMGSGVDENRTDEEAPDQERPPYAGHAGGAVGGTPAEDRAKGGHVHHGIVPGGVHRGDSTIGARPEEKTE